MKLHETGQNLQEKYLNIEHCFLENMNITKSESLNSKLKNGEVFSKICPKQFKPNSFENRIQIAKKAKLLPKKTVKLK